MSEKEEKDVDELDEDEKEKSFIHNQFQHTSVNNDMYALPIRRRQKKREELPSGWERHEVGQKLAKLVALKIQYLLYEGLRGRGSLLRNVPW